MTHVESLKVCSECGGSGDFGDRNWQTFRRGYETKFDSGLICEQCVRQRLVGTKDGYWIDEDCVYDTPRLQNDRVDVEDWREIPENWVCVRYYGMNTMQICVDGCLRCGRQTRFELETHDISEYELADPYDIVGDWVSSVEIRNEHRTLDYGAVESWDETDHPDRESDLIGIFIIHLSNSRFVKRGIVCDDCFDEVLSTDEEECTKCIQPANGRKYYVPCPECQRSGCHLCDDDGIVPSCCEGYRVTPETRNFEFFV